MYPILNIYKIKIPMYGLFITIGIIFALLVILKKSEYMGIKREDCFYASLYGVIGLIVGGKLLYIITIMDIIVKNISRIFERDYINAIFSGGFVYYGGLMGVILMIYIYSKQYKINFLKLLDCMVLGFPLAYAIGRVGCFMAGCCYGIPSSFGVYFNNSQVAPHGVKLFPIQLIDAFINLVFFLIFYFKIAKNKKYSGHLIVIYLMFYSIERFILEFFRYDKERGIIFFFSTSQWISIIIFIVICILLAVKRQNRIMSKK